MPRRLTGLAVAFALQLLALVLAHEVVFLARWGSRYNEALAHGGHGESWGSAVITVLGLGALVAALALGRLAHLGLLLRRATGRTRMGSTASHRSRLERRDLVRASLIGVPRTAIATAVLLTIQEHLERSSVGFGPTGPGILLSPEYAGGLWIALAVGFAVGLVAALFEWRRRVLLARLRSHRPRLARAATAAGRRPGVIVLPPVESILGRRSALRAPPRRPELLPAG